MDTSIYSALVHQMLSSPASAMVVVGLSIVAYVFEIWPSFNNRVIAPLTILMGPCVYWLFAAPGSVPAIYPHPSAVLVVNGLVCGLFASGTHVFGTRNVMGWLREKREASNFKPQASGNGEKADKNETK